MSESVGDNEQTAEPVVELEKSVQPEDTAPVEQAPAEVKEVTEPVQDTPVASEAVPSKGIRVDLYRVALAAAAVLAVLSLVLGYFWHSASSDLDALKTSNSDRDRAAEVARDYTMRSLSYDYKNLPAFFDGVQRGTSDALRDRYTSVHDTLAKIMTQAQVIATGDVVGTAVEAKGNDQYVVTVFATQRTQNIQQTEPATVPNLLLVTVAKSGGDWVVVDYGPKDSAVKDPAATAGAAK
ncbi:hypothetical protein AB0N05_27385 [Nocardia sp. NPDC051030]|uniref:hypothetical protein n=1 Tax=Nocardia sp. NPDC051030 TaxID=3155162 RepID=UPI00343FF45E